MKSQQNTVQFEVCKKKKSFMEPENEPTIRIPVDKDD